MRVFAGFLLEKGQSAVPSEPDKTRGRVDVGSAQSPKPLSASSDTDDATTNGPCPVLALAAVRPDARTPIWCKLPPKMEGWFSTPTHGSLVHFPSYETAERNPNLFLAAVLSVANLALHEVARRCLPQRLRSSVLPARFLAPHIRSHEFGLHTPRRQSLLQQQQPARFRDPSSRQAQSSTVRSPHTDSHNRPSLSVDRGPRSRVAQYGAPDDHHTRRVGSPGPGDARFTSDLPDPHTTRTRHSTSLTPRHGPVCSSTTFKIPHAHFRLTVTFGSRD